MNETKHTKDIQPEKAYKNLDFLNSKDARTLRILSEYLYTKKQFEEQNVQNTIVIFGSARAPSPEEASDKTESDKGRSKSLKLAEYYDATRILSKRLSEWYVDPELNFEFHYFFTRKFWFSYLAKALVIMPGGFGTLDEFFEILTLIQTGKIKKDQPIVLFGEEYWSKLINFETLVDYGVIDRKDLDLFFLTSSVDEAYEHITSRLG